MQVTWDLTLSFSNRRLLHVPTHKEDHRLHRLIPSNSLTEIPQLGKSRICPLFSNECMSPSPSFPPVPLFCLVTVGMKRHTGRTRVAGGNPRIAGGELITSTAIGGRGLEFLGRCFHSGKSLDHFCLDSYKKLFGNVFRSSPLLPATMALVAGGGGFI